MKNPNFIKIEFNDLSAGLDPTQCIVYWALVNAQRARRNNLGFKSFQELLALIPCRLSLPQLRRVIKVLQDRGLIEYVATYNYVKFELKNCPETDRFFGGADDQNDHDQNDHRDQNDHEVMIKMITSDDQNDHTHFIYNKNLEKNLGKNLSATHAQKSPPTPTLNPEADQNAIANNTQPTVSEVASRFCSKNNQIKKEVAEVEAQKFLNYYQSQKRNISAIWEHLADNWMLRDLDGSFRKNSVPGMELTPGTYVESISFEQRMQMFKEMGFGN